MGIKHSDFVTHLVKDAAKPPQVTLLRGYVGPGADKGNERIYFDATLRRYVDVPRDGILHMQTDPSSKLEAQFVWIDPKAEVTVPESETTSTTTSRLLDGSIVDTFLGLAQPHTGAGPIAKATPICGGTTPNGVIAVTCTATTPQTMAWQRIVNMCCSATTPQTEISFRNADGWHQQARRCCAATTPQSGDSAEGDQLAIPSDDMAAGAMTPWAMPNPICVTPRTS